jgi:hypothetical protein
MPTVSLAAHSASIALPVAGVEVRVDRDACGLQLVYVVRGAPAGLRFPPPASPARRYGLWRYTCAEAFLRTTAQGYCEFNFSPSGEWAAYQFTAERQGMASLPFDTPRIRLDASPDALRLSVAIGLDERFAGPLDVGLACVLQGADGGLGWWALRHARAQPDFHAPESFALHLPAAATHAVASTA